MENDFTIEELKTAIGYLMSDLRHSWACNYTDRMEEVVELLELLISKDDNNEYIEDLNTTNEELGDPQDGRVFRDSCYLYGYSSKEGKTEQVREYLQYVLEFPEYIDF